MWQLLDCYSSWGVSSPTGIQSLRLRSEFAWRWLQAPRVAIMYGSDIFRGVRNSWLPRGLFELRCFSYNPTIGGSGPMSLIIESILGEAPVLFLYKGIWPHLKPVFSKWGTLFFVFGRPLRGPKVSK